MLFHGTRFLAETVSRETIIFAEMKPDKTAPSAETTAQLLQFREKRKWQIALRRYVIEKNACVYYAPFFGLDIKTLRIWFEQQFPPAVSWDSFGKNWHFGHIVPVSAFDFTNTDDMKLCWHFTNLQVRHFKNNSEKENTSGLMAAKTYYLSISNTVPLPAFTEMLHKIETLLASEKLEAQQQIEFLNRNATFITQIKDYNSFEFELLNNGRSIAEIETEMAFQKKFQ